MSKVEKIQKPKVEIDKKEQEELSAKRKRMIDLADSKEEKVEGPKRGRPKGSKGKKGKRYVSPSDIIKEEQVRAWSVITMNFTIIIKIMIEVIWKDWPMSEAQQDAHTRAWAIRFAVTPPENIELLANLNIMFVYAAIIGPRAIKSFIDYRKKKSEKLKEKEEKNEKGKTESTMDKSSPKQVV